MTEIMHYRHEQPFINSFSLLDAYVKEREEVFTARLAHIAQRSAPFYGWERMDRETNRKAEALFDSPDSYYSGTGMCAIATIILLQALPPLSQGIEYTPVALFTDMNAHSWDDPTHTLISNLHFFLKATDQRTNKTRFIDPTIGQIHPLYIGKIVTLDPDELAVWYKKSDQKISFVDTKFDIAASMKDYYADGFSSDDFEYVKEALL